MVASSSEFQTKILRRNLVPDEYDLYRAALEWDLTDPIVIETRKDLKSEKRWQEHLQPYHHQVTNLITFCRRLPVTLLADDVGLGKTISAVAKLASGQRKDMTGACSQRIDAPSGAAVAGIDELANLARIEDAVRLFRIDGQPEDRRLQPD